MPIPVASADDCRLGLSAVLGIRNVVRKTREVRMFGATRIHLDDVADLGCFVELETVVTSQTVAAAIAEHRACLDLADIDPDATVPGSYTDLVATGAPGA